MFAITEQINWTNLCDFKKDGQWGKTAAVQVEKKQNFYYQGGITGERERS